jgi:hypothetical protein
VREVVDESRTIRIQQILPSGISEVKLELLCVGIELSKDCRPCFPGWFEEDRGDSFETRIYTAPTVIIR